MIVGHLVYQNRSLRIHAYMQIQDFVAIQMYSPKAMEDGREEDVAKTTEERTVSPIILRL